MFCYNSIQLYDTKFYKNKQTNFREFLVVARVWVGGTRATLLGGAFRKAKYEKLRRRKNRNRKTRVGKNSFPPNPLPFCPPERSVSAARSAAISRDFVQKRFELRSVIATNQDISNFQGKEFARSPRLRRGYARFFPYISELNRKVGQIQIQFFGKANGGSFQFFLSPPNFVFRFAKYATKIDVALAPTHQCAGSDKKLPKK